MWWTHYRTNILQGFRRGELTIFSGRTGQGKTTFLSEYSLDLCMQNVTTLWGSFEVKNSRLAKMQLKQFSGVNLEENLDSFDKWADLFQKMPMFYMTFFGANEVSSSTYWIFKCDVLAIALLRIENSTSCITPKSWQKSKSWHTN